MNTDQLKGKLQDAVGHVKQGVGEALGDDHMANQGVADQAKGSVRETWGNVKDATGADRVSTPVATDSRYADDTSAHDTAADARDGVSNALHNVTNAINRGIDHLKNDR